MSLDPGTAALLSVAEMGEADRLAIDGGTPGRVLMDAAGEGVADAVVARFPRGPVTVLCGPGNNGGDGYVAARYLAARGWPVAVVALGDPEALKGDAAWAARGWNGPIYNRLDGHLPDGAIVIDALFGAGLTRPLDGGAAALVSAMAGHPVVAVDLPSGLDGDSGQPLGSAPRATLTVTFFRKKPGHLLQPGRSFCGAVRVIDIGIPAAVLARIGPRTWENLPALWRAALPVPDPEGHKYARGHLCVLSGPVMTGAARLAAAGGRRVGAGLTTVLADPGVWPVLAADAPGLLLRRMDELADLVADNRRNAWIVGPGLGVGKETRRAALAIAAAGHALVLDADAITSFADRPADLFEADHGALVLTPHEGEFGRLFPGLTGTRLERARVAAARSGAVLVLKGSDTVIAHPDGRAAINANAPADLATAGSGDVRAGLIGGLLAQRMPAFEAAAAAVWMHGETATNLGAGLIAEDLAPAIPEVLQNLRALD
ncbi:MAG: NAD(P)H-hydrate dehydratase [Azospirillaceae bacterium]